MHGACGGLNVLPGARSWHDWPMGRVAGCFCSHPVPPAVGLHAGYSHILNYPCSQAAPLGLVEAPVLLGAAGSAVCPVDVTAGRKTLACPHCHRAGTSHPTLPSFPVPTPDAAGPHSIAFPWQRVLPSPFQSEQ